MPKNDPIHLETDSDDLTYLLAADRWAEAIGRPIGTLTAREARAKLEPLRQGLTGPIEVRVGSADSEPVLIAWPDSGRAAGEAEKARAVAKNEWVTTKSEIIGGPNKEPIGG